MSENASIDVNGSVLGTSLQQMLEADGIQPGSAPGYELCKQIYLYHPLGKKMADAPVSKAQSQQREISIPGSPEDDVKKAFSEEWEAIGADRLIFSTMSQSRVYGICSLAYGVVGKKPSDIIDPQDFASLEMFFSVFDPLNTAGSLVTSQNPNSPDFQKHSGIAVSGESYHRSRSVTVMNEEPIYISYTSSAFGFVGRSVYQRALFPLKTYIQSMVTDDMVVQKGGLLIAMMKQAGSIVDNMMAKVSGFKRTLLQRGKTGNVMTIGHEDKIETLDLKNSEIALTAARKNVLENCAAAADMPASMLNNETFAEGFGEGTEDAKNVAQYIQTIREEMRPLYQFLDNIVMYRAWNKEFYKTIQAKYPDEYGSMDYMTAFMSWKNAFTAIWPSLLIEPESELVKVDETKLKTVVSIVEVMAPQMDPENRARVLIWAADNINDMKRMFTVPLNLDYEALAAYEPPAPPEMAEPKPEKL